MYEFIFVVIGLTLCYYSWQQAIKTEATLKANAELFIKIQKQLEDTNPNREYV